MNGLTGKGLLTAGALLAAVTGWGYEVGEVVDEVTKTANLDTRDVVYHDDAPIVVSSVDEAFDLAWNNAVDWRKGGDGEGEPLALIKTPMLAIPDGIAAWIVDGVTTALVEAQTGEGTANYSPALGHGYRFDLFSGAELKETRFGAVGAEQLEARATVAVTNLALVAGQTIEPEITVLEGKTVGTPVCRWYKYSFEEKWNEGEIASGEANITLPEGEYEYGLRLLITDENGFVGMSEPVWISKLPVIYIDTDGGVEVVSKTIDYGASMRMQGGARFTDANELYNGRLTLHVRGNTTSLANKKPYKIKLDKKADLLGLGKDKHWVLLSNPYDFSLMRNKIMYDLSAKMGLTAMESEWVDVVLNGEYVGNYLCCEHIRVGKNRVNIYDWESTADDIADTIATSNAFDKAATKDLETYLEENLAWATAGEFTWTNGVTYVLGDYGIKTNEFDISGGYLFELDKFEDENTMFYAGAGPLDMLTKANRPEFLGSNPVMLDFTKTMWSNYWASCISPDGYYQGVHYSEQSDVDSMAAYWLIQVIGGSGQANGWSRYAYKPVDEPIHWGPAWDYDTGLGGPAFNWEFDDAGNVTTRPMAKTGWSCGLLTGDPASFYREWVDDPYFCLKLVECYSAIQNYLENLLKDNGKFDANFQYLYESGVANAARWAGNIAAPGSGQYVSQYMRFDGENGDVAWLKETLQSRVAWIKERVATVRTAVRSLNETQASVNPYTDSAEKFSFAFKTAHYARPDSNEGATPDIMVSDASNLAVRVELVELAGAKTVDVYVNALSNGTCQVEGDAIEFSVAANRFTNTKDKSRNMISLVAKDEGGQTLATTYSLVTTVKDGEYPQAMSNAMIVVDIADVVPATGEPYEPEVTVTTPDGVVLTNGLDYTVEYLDNVNPGTATVRITGLGNLMADGKFPRGNWIGTVERTFTIVGDVRSNTLEGISLDTRANTVRKPASADEILPFAWNGGSAWPTNGTGAGNAVVSVVPVAGEGTDPAAWTNAGPVRTFVDEAGEGTNVWVRPYAKLYRATLVQDAGAVTNTAFFDLRELDLPTDPVDLLKTAFGDTVEITVAANGDPTVKLTEDRDGGATVPAGVGAFTLDLNGCSIVGTNGLDLVDGQHGGAGGAAVVVAEDTVLTLADATGEGRLVGGNGGAPRGKGGEAVAYANGEAAPVLGQVELLVKGQDGGATVTVDTAELANLDFDTRVGAVRTPTAISDILPFAWNNTAGWFAGGDPEGGVTAVSVVPVNGEGSDPMAWTDAGPARTFVEAKGENTAVWDRQYAKLYRATLVQEEGAVTNVAFFDLRGLELPPDPVDFLREAFGDGVEITLDAAGDPTVKLTDDLTGPVTLPAEVGAFTLDLAGKTLSGTNGVDGSAVAPGTAGGPAIVAGTGVEIRVAGPGAIVGGKGGNGAPAGAGGEAIVGTATVVDPAGLVKRGADGEDIGGAVQVEIDEIRPCAPWNGDIEVRYTCRNLRAGAGYKEVFHVTVNGVERCVTNAVPTLDVGYTSISKSFVIDGEALFGANVKDNKAKVRIELVPVPPGE